MQRYPHGEMAVVLDCEDLDRAARFWTEVLGISPRKSNAVSKQEQYS